jgi:hypothetical protein
MTHLYPVLLPVVVKALLLFLLSRLLFVGVVSSLADRRGKGFLLGLLRLPGNFVHELSHALGFWACGYRVQQIRLSVFDPKGRGSCQPGRAWSPITVPWLAIGLASLMPLVLGSLLLIFAARWLQVLPDIKSSLPPHHLISGLWQEVRLLLLGLDWHRWQTYAFLYLALSLGAELSPSSVDLRYGVPALLGLTAGMWLFFFAAEAAPGLHETGRVASVSVIHACRWLGSVLTLALTVTAAITVITLLPGLIIRAVRRR